jgi:transcriptional regulator with XRE-family HTH domain
MATKRHRLAQRRKALGFTQEGLAEQLGVDMTTVRRWESGAIETGPQPWLRPKLARCLQVSIEQLAELLDADTDKPDSLPEQASAGEKKPQADLPGFTGQSGVFVPVIVDGCPVLVPLDGKIDVTTWNTMSPSDRRSVLGYGLAATAAWVVAEGHAAGAQGQPAPLRNRATRAPASWSAATSEAVLHPMEAARRAAAASDVRVHDLSALRVVIDQAMHVSLSSDYGALEQSLPTLIGCVEAATSQAADEPPAYQALSDVYAVVGWTLIKADHTFGASIAASRAVQAAEQAGDVLRLAAATRCLAEVHMRANSFEEATRTAFLATVHLQSVPSEDKLVATSLRGAALLSAAASSARRGDSREAHAALKAAGVCAAERGQERSDFATVFGPTNVAIHRVAIAIELGDARAALRHVPALQLDRMPKPLTERRARCLIDVARSYAQVRDDMAAIDALLQAETIAPDELRHHRLTRELVPQLMTRESRTPGLRALARRCNLLDEESTR